MSLIISSLVFAVVQQTPAIPSLVEIRQPDAKESSIECLIKLPDLSPAQRYVLSASAKMAIRRTLRYGSNDIRAVQSLGTNIRIRESVDALRIGMVVPTESTRTGLSVLHSILVEPSFLADEILREEPLEIKGWERVTQTFQSQPAPFGPDDVRAFWRTLMRPTNVFIAVKGNFAEGYAAAHWETKKEGWYEERQAPLTFRGVKPTVAATDSVNLLVKDGTPILSSDPALPTYLLAANLLGVGKESLLWKLSREELGWSYRQEAFLIPLTRGWTLRMAIASNKTSFTEKEIAQFDQLLLARIQKLDASDMTYALGIADGYLKYDLPTAPIVTGGTPESFNSLSWNLYWGSKTRQPWNSESLRQSMRQVRLEDVKEVLVTFVKESKRVNL